MKRRPRERKKGSERPKRRKERIREWMDRKGREGGDEMNGEMQMGDG